jgi:hypothetical protein
VVTFTVANSGGELGAADVFLLGAVAVCAVAYAEGGVLSRDLGGARTICWAAGPLDPGHHPARGVHRRHDRPAR